MSATAAAASCKTCKRSFANTPNPMVREPKADDLLKRAGTLAQCQPCCNFIKKEPQYSSMSRKELLEHLGDSGDFNAFMSKLTEWEENRREGRRRPKGGNDSKVEAETKHGLTTRQLKGYLWPKDLLKTHGELKSMGKSNTTTISHMGKTVTGIIRDKWVLGAIEIYEDSSHTAVRKRAVADAVDAEGAEECMAELTAQAV